MIGTNHFFRKMTGDKSGELVQIKKKKVRAFDYHV
jgi:hypothetical protein